MDKIVIHHGDALAILKTLPSTSVDAVVTDPPYSSGGATLAARQDNPVHKYLGSDARRAYPPLLGDGKDQRSQLAWATLWLAECWRITRDGMPLLLFTDWRQLPVMTDAVQGAGWYWQGIVVWNKKTCRPRKGKFRPQCEYILFASKGRHTPATPACFPGLYDCSVTVRDKIHMTGKPVPLLRELLAVTPAGGVVLDPFVGGGTTAIAALETGRSCIGIDLSEEYVRIARERIAKM
jgi:site-specific DNA-methyltransferase (adenine-specific)